MPVVDDSMDDADVFYDYSSPNKSLLDDVDEEEDYDEDYDTDSLPPPPPPGPPPSSDRSFQMQNAAQSAILSRNIEEDLEDPVFLDIPFEGEEIEPPPGNFMHLQAKPDDIIMTGSPRKNRKGFVIMSACLLIVAVSVALGFAISGKAPTDATSSVSSTADDFEDGGTETPWAVTVTASPTEAPTATGTTTTTASSTTATTTGTSTPAPASAATAPPTAAATLASTATGTAPPTASATLAPTSTVTSSPTAAATVVVTSEATETATAAATEVTTATATDTATQIATTLITGGTCTDTIIVEDACYSLGDDIVVTFENCEPRVDDWVGIYPNDAAIDPNNLGSPPAWIWTCGSQTCGGEVSGDTLSVSYDLDDLEAGSYIAYLVRLPEDGEAPYPAYAMSAPFEVTSTACGATELPTEGDSSAPPTEGATTETPTEVKVCESIVMTDQSCYGVGEEINILFENCEPAPDDWIGIYTDDPDRDPDDVGDPIDWLWTCGTQNCRGIAFVDTLPFGGGLDEGVYTAYLVRLPEDGEEPYPSYAMSDPFVISSTGCP